MLKMPEEWSHSLESAKPSSLDMEEASPHALGFLSERADCLKLTLSVIGEVARSYDGGNGVEHMSISLM